MTYDQIEALSKIIETGSFKAAASQLNKSQPSVSVAIKNLELELGFDLFDRSQYRPKLTDSGEIYYQHAKKALETFNELHLVAQAIKLDQAAAITMSVDAIFPYHLLKKPLDDFRYKFPYVDFNLVIDVMDGAEQRVLNQEAELALCPVFENKEEIEAKYILTIKMIPVIHTELARSINFDWQKLNTIPQLIAKSTGTIPSNRQLGVLAGAKKWHLNDNSAKRELLLSAMGWGRLPEHQIKSELENKTLTIIEDTQVPAFDIPIYLIRKKMPLNKITNNDLWSNLHSYFR
jgi:DNA-binding transcriptional LysR family regulator